MPQPRPEGIEWTITDDWIEWLVKRLEEEGLSQRELAAKIVDAGGQATGAAISDIITRKTPRSRLVPAINAVLGGPVPRQIITDYDLAVDETRRRIIAKIVRLKDEDFALVLEWLTRLTRGS